MNKLVCAALLTLLLAGVSQAGELVPKELFHIERSKNANVVRYDAQLTQNGVFDRKAPVIAYWLMLAEDGRRENLNYLERTKAYGFRIVPESPGKSYRMTLEAYDKRAIKVYLKSQDAKAEMVVDGKPAYLEKVYIQSEEGAWWPKVSYIELFGTDVATGEKRHEKIVP